MTSPTPTSAEPTEVDYERAADVVTILYGTDLINYNSQTEALEPVARALASQRAEIVARYEAAPTAEQLRPAWNLIAQWREAEGLEPLADLIARALAAAVTAEREKYLRVALQLETDASGRGHAVSGTYDRGVQLAQQDAARRIREVSR